MASRLESLGNIREKAVELGLYLPLGAYSKVRDELSDLNGRRIRQAFEGLIERGEDRMEPVERLVRRRTRQVENKVEDAVDDVQREVSKTARKTTEAGHGSSRLGRSEASSGRGPQEGQRACHQELRVSDRG